MEQILQHLQKIERLIESQNLSQKAVLNFDDACTYLDVSASHLYKLTSARQVPHFCPQGKKLYFNRQELEAWLQRNRQSTTDEQADEALENMTSKKRNNNSSNSKKQ